MKLLIAATALALAVPSVAVADPVDQSRPDVGSPAPVGMPPHSDLDTDALGTDVAASDQQSPVQRSAAPVVVPSPANGFEFDDAAVGAGAAITLVAMVGAGGIALRRRRSLVG